MSRYVDSKKVIVKSAGTIHLLGGVTGPILSAFPCKVDTIYSMVVTKVQVFEILPDGTELKMTLENYNIVNTKEEKVEEQTNEEVQRGINGESLVEDTKDIKVSDPSKTMGKNFNKPYQKNNKQHK